MKNYLYIGAAAAGLVFAAWSLRGSVAEAAGEVWRGITERPESAPRPDPDGTLGGLLYDLGHDDDTNEPNVLGQTLDHWLLY